MIILNDLIVLIANLQQSLPEIIVGIFFLIIAIIAGYVVKYLIIKGKKRKNWTRNLVTARRKQIAFLYFLANWDLSPLSCSSCQGFSTDLN